MISRKIFIPFAVVIILSLLPACQSKKQAEEKSASPSAPIKVQAASTQSKPAQNNTASTNPLKNAEPPRQLEIIRSNSASVVFDIIKIDWKTAQERLDIIKSNMTELKPLLTASSVPAALTEGINSGITNLEKSIAGKKVHEAKADANNITKYIPDIEDLYKVAVPTDLSRISYLNREIHININHSDWLSAEDNFKKARELWDKLKAGMDQSTKTQSSSFENNFRQLGKALDTHDPKGVVINSNELIADIGALKLKLHK